MCRSCSHVVVAAAVMMIIVAAAGCAPGSPPPLAPLPLHEVDIGVCATPAKPLRPVMAVRQSQPPPEGEWAAPGVRKWRYLVIHHSASDDGNAEGFDAMHRRRGWDELGYHFVIDNGNGGPDGRVEVGSRWRSQKWGAHTGGTPNNEYNNYGIGICLVGNFSSGMPSQAQLGSLSKLSAYLTDTYEIPPANVIGHRDAPNARTECPGDALHSYVHGPLRSYLAGREALRTRLRYPPSPRLRRDQLRGAGLPGG